MQPKERTISEFNLDLTNKTKTRVFTLVYYKLINEHIPKPATDQNSRADIYLFSKLIVFLSILLVLY